MQITPLESVGSKSATRSASKLESCILKTLLYFDIFQYPLTGTEVLRYLRLANTSEDTVLEGLRQLEQAGLIFRHQNFFSLCADDAQARRRTKGNAKARELMPLALKRARLISRFPFVRAVMASGSISKDYMDDKSDIDFFIVTAPGRLFISRTLLVMFKRIFLRNSHRYFCVNYFVDENHLEIEEKNQFTATELATVKPLYNPEIYLQLMMKNGWLKFYFPNLGVRETDGTLNHKSGFFKKLFENTINLFAIPVERAFLAFTLRRWKRIYAKNYLAEEFTVAFKTTPHTSKNHPRSFQRKVIELYEQKIMDFSNAHNLTLQ